MDIVDIRIERGEELLIGYEDLELVEGEECLIQDIRTKLYTDTGALFYDPNYGGNLLRYIQCSKDKNTLSKLEQDIRIALKEDNRIDSNAIKINITPQQDQLLITINFKTKEGNDITLQESV